MKKVYFTILNHVSRASSYALTYFDWILHEAAEIVNWAEGM